MKTRNEKISETKTDGREAFFAKCREVHGDTYDYADVVFTKASDKLTFTCRTHGEFAQLGYAHRHGQGCPVCAAAKRRKNMTSSTSKFIASAARIHGDAYTYDNTVYTTARGKLTISCREHGDFVQVAKNHLDGSGCPVCALARRSESLVKSTSTFVEQAKNVHGDRYDYEDTQYTKAANTVSIKCRVHGVFTQLPYVHLRGAGCSKCGNIVSSNTRAATQAEYESKARRAHGSKYEYGAYSRAHASLEIECPEHGVFTQLAHNHVQGMGCPRCAATSSQPEQDITAFISSSGYVATSRYRPDWMQGKELDIFVPELNLAIEYCGSWVHNSTRNPFGAPTKKEWYHYDKWKLCRDNGVTLLTIYDFEWFASREKWEAVIRHKLQKADRRVYARKCQIVSVDRAVAYQFCKDHHIESAGGAWTYQALCLGLEHQGELVAVMVEDKGDIKRSCTLSGTAVIGGVSRLFKAFPAGTTMMTTNNTGSSGKYGTLLSKKTTRYWWVSPDRPPTAIPRRQCQKQLLEKRFGVPVGEKTERQYMEDLGYVRCYDSGLSYWVNT